MISVPRTMYTLTFLGQISYLFCVQDDLFFFMKLKLEFWVLQCLLYSSTQLSNSSTIKKIIIISVLYYNINQFDLKSQPIRISILLPD
ncbi:hypothetical protein Hanom_Chr06g00477781 [Helianthus anomalus]